MRRPLLIGEAAPGDGPPLVLEGVRPGSYTADDSDRASAKGEALRKLLWSLASGPSGSRR